MKYNRYVVLCEDLQAFVFIRRALLVCGATGRNIRDRPYAGSTFQQSGGTGARRVREYNVYPCGSQHVLENFPGEVAELRDGQRPGKKAALIVHVDVDNTAAQGRSVPDRLKELSSACTAKSVSPPKETEPVAFLIPRRNIETWIENLEGTRVDEHSEYEKRKGRESDAWPAAESFGKHAVARTTPENATDSLVRGLAQLRKVL